MRSSVWALVCSFWIVLAFAWASVCVTHPTGRADDVLFGSLWATLAVGISCWRLRTGKMTRGWRIVFFVLVLMSFVSLVYVLAFLARRFA
jgi:hypothetical protein